MDEIKKFKVNSAEFYKVRADILGKKAEYPTSILNENGKELTDTIESLKEHECYFKKLLSSRKPENKYKKHVRLKTILLKNIVRRQGDSRSPENAPFMKWELQNVLNSLKTKKCPGLDNM